ncbi:MAG: BamA/TamA family outer membrane protein, partial [Candidatus Eremiobacterota bacterium]
FPIGEHTLAFRVLGGTSTGDLPLSDQFYLGGNDTLRAYEQGEFLGDRVFLFQAEYRFPILKSRVLQGALFFDAGNATQRDSVKGLFDNIKSDEGIGIRVAVPALGIGAIRVDYAIKNEGGGGRIVIGIGQTF